MNRQEEFDKNVWVCLTFIKNNYPIITLNIIDSWHPLYSLGLSIQKCLLSGCHFSSPLPHFHWLFLAHRDCWVVPHINAYELLFLEESLSVSSDQSPPVHTYEPIPDSFQDFPSLPRSLYEFSSFWKLSSAIPKIFLCVLQFYN